MSQKITIDQVEKLERNSHSGCQCIVSVLTKFVNKSLTNQETEILTSKKRIFGNDQLLFWELVRTCYMLQLRR